LRGFNDVSAINSVRVAGDACAAFAATDVSEVAQVSAGGFVPVVPCSNEHIRQNSAVKTFSGEIRGNLISDAPPFGRLPYGEPDAISNAIGYAKFLSRFA